MPDRWIPWKQLAAHFGQPSNAVWIDTGLKSSRVRLSLPNNERPLVITGHDKPHIDSKSEHTTVSMPLPEFPHWQMRSSHRPYTIPFLQRFSHTLHRTQNNWITTNDKGMLHNYLAQQLQKDLAELNNDAIDWTYSAQEKLRLVYKLSIANKTVTLSRIDLEHDSHRLIHAVQTLLQMGQSIVVDTDRWKKSCAAAGATPWTASSVKHPRRLFVPHKLSVQSVPSLLSVTHKHPTRRSRYHSCVCIQVSQSAVASFTLAIQEELSWFVRKHETPHLSQSYKLTKPCSNQLKTIFKKSSRHFEIVKPLAVIGDRRSVRIYLASATATAAEITAACEIAWCFVRPAQTNTQSPYR